MFSPGASQAPIEAASGWITDTLLGDLAVTLCVIAVALVGFSMLTGRLAIRRGAQVVLGCFVLLGAPLIAASLIAPWQRGDASAAPLVPVYDDAFAPREALPPPGPGGALYQPPSQPAPEPAPAPAANGAQ